MGPSKSTSAVEIEAKSFRRIAGSQAIMNLNEMRRPGTFFLQHHSRHARAPASHAKLCHLAGRGIGWPLAAGESRVSSADQGGLPPHGSIDPGLAGLH